jgi:hypothetical protein
MKHCIRLATLVLALSSALSLRADIIVYMHASGGFWLPSTGPGTGVLDANGGVPVLVQLMHAGADGYPDLANGALAWNDDIVLASFTVGNGGAVIPLSSYADVDAIPIYQGPHIPGFIFGRVLAQFPPEYGTWYYDGPLVPAWDITPSLPTPPQAYDINRNADWLGNPRVGDAFDHQAIPEPSVLAFLGMGGLVGLVRRIFRR